MKSLKGNFKTLRAQVNARVSVDQTGDIIDLKGYNAVKFITGFGDGGDTYDNTNKIEQYLQESNDGSTWNDVLAEHVQGALAGSVHTSTYALIDAVADKNKIYVADYIGFKRYVRTMTDFIGTHSSGMPLNTIAILQPENILPVF
jgi:hypothetical protein